MKKGKSSSMMYESMIKTDTTGFKALSTLMISVPIAAGAASLRTVDKNAIEKFFTKLKSTQ